MTRVANQHEAPVQSTEFPPPRSTTHQIAISDQHASNGRFKEIDSCWCEYCGGATATKTTKRPGRTTWAFSFSLCLICMCWLPFLLSCCQDRYYYCIQCGALKEIQNPCCNQKAV